MNFRSHFLGPIVAIVSASVLALIGGLLWLTTIQNRAESASEQVRVEAAFNDRVRALKDTVHIFAQWDEAALNLASAAVNPAWADTHEARYLYDQFGYEHTFIVDAEGLPLYASTNGARSEAVPTSLITSGPVCGQASGPDTCTTWRGRRQRFQRRPAYFRHIPHPGKLSCCR